MPNYNQPDLKSQAHIEDWILSIAAEPETEANNRQAVVKEHVYVAEIICLLTTDCSRVQHSIPYRDQPPIEVKTITTAQKTRNDSIDHLQNYEKRLRHKTRPNKYDYKAGVESEVATGTQRGVKRKRFPGTSMPGDFFKAANVNAARVSLKPNFNLSIFSKGKTSAQIANCDMPDLTFPSMKFLSKPANIAQEITTNTTIKKSRSKTDTLDNLCLENPQFNKSNRKYAKRYPSNQNNHPCCNKLSSPRRTACFSSTRLSSKYRPYDEQAVHKSL